jgi:hypothetical protein
MVEMILSLTKVMMLNAIQKLMSGILIVLLEDYELGYIIKDEYHNSYC